MKKGNRYEKEVRIIKNNDLMDNGTSLTAHILLLLSLQTLTTKVKRDDQVRKLTDKNKKKKVAIKKDNASRGLKYIIYLKEITPRFMNNSSILV
jgi:hypothetical protein